MRFVIQRVASASVHGIIFLSIPFPLITFFPLLVQQQLVGSIQEGLCVLVGINREDTVADAEKLYYIHISFS